MNHHTSRRRRAKHQHRPHLPDRAPQSQTETAKATVTSPPRKRLSARQEAIRLEELRPAAHRARVTLILALGGFVLTVAVSTWLTFDPAMTKATWTIVMLSNVLDNGIAVSKTYLVPFAAALTTLPVLMALAGQASVRRHARNPNSNGLIVSDWTISAFFASIILVPVTIFAYLVSRWNPESDLITPAANGWPITVGLITLLEFLRRMEKVDALIRSGPR